MIIEKLYAIIALILEQQGDIMPDYKSMYFSLFNSVTDAIEILKAAQQKGEDTYINNNEEPIHLIKTPSDTPKAAK